MFTSVPHRLRSFSFFSILLFAACKSKKVEHPFFTTMQSTKTGLHFSNKLYPTEHFNLFSYMYYYNGAGTATADFNKDGKIDIFFTANQGDNKLFLNQGKLQFKDVTSQANIQQDSSWSTGVSVIDINNDGLMDIYICKVGNYKSLQSKNQLLICSGFTKDSVPQYKDEAARYGLDFSGFSTQAAFFDYDGDNDLDMFLLNHSVNHDGNYAPRNNFTNTFDSLAGQRLYKNQGKIVNGKMQTFFTDVTKETGVLGTKIGYGLGVVVSDINMDGWLDLYVGNDFHENDYLYINQKNGTFKEEGTTQLNHTSQFSMGVDAADVNNDCRPDIISMDMLPYDPYMLKRSLAEDDYNIYTQKIKYGYSYQYSRNNLQYNKGNGHFTEVAQYAGVHASDWSWSALWTDFNNDGDKDLFISNGIPKRMNDIDYINFVSNEELQVKLKTNTVSDKEIALSNKFPEIKIPNQFYLNKKNFSFTNLEDSIEKNLSTFSTSAAYADFDNDGDIDIVVNNIDDEALIYKNNANEKKQSFINIELQGDSANLNAIGAKVVLYTNQGRQFFESTPVHGFQSSMQVPIHIGLGNTTIDSVIVIWPNNQYEKINCRINQLTRVRYSKKYNFFEYTSLTLKNIYDKVQWKDITASTNLNYIHQENEFNEFIREQLLPKMNSTDGPALAIGDVNGDNLDDVFVGASKGFHNAIFTQNKNGIFLKMLQPEMLLDSMYENVDAEIVDINGDGFKDIVIASGGNEYYDQDSHLLPLVYINNGKGIMKRKLDAISNIYTTQSCIVVNDFNNDGAIDLFIGSKTIPWAYGAMPKSYLLANDGHGVFTDVTTKYFKDLSNQGMVTSAMWADWNNDKQQDLIVTNEWGTINVFEKKGNTFNKKSISENGWWNFALSIDFNKDGKLDLFAGNIGTNTKLQASRKQPLEMYCYDFDANGKSEQLFTYYLRNEKTTFASMQEIERQLPYLKKKYLYAADFAKSSINDLVGKDKLDKAKQYSATYLQSTVIDNSGVKINLPWEVQINNIKSAITIDANQDGYPDLLLAGNYFDNNVQIGRQDGCTGVLLINNTKGNFIQVPLNGITLDGQIRKMKSITIQQKDYFIAIRNNGPLMIFGLN
jgi:enediyne biosynthesis protein E4